MECLKHMADECLDRVARKLEERVEIQNLNGYRPGGPHHGEREPRPPGQREQAVMQELSQPYCDPAEAEAIERRRFWTSRSA